MYEIIIIENKYFRNSKKKKAKSISGYVDSILSVKNEVSYAY